MTDAMTRYLRSAAAVLLALLTVALLALWVRSYHVRDLIYASHGHVVLFKGTCTCWIYNEPWPGDELLPSWTSQPEVAKGDSPWGRGFLGFRLVKDAVDTELMIPYWFLVAATVSAASLFNLKRSWRFTTRGLLIGTTVVAGMLGLGVYLF
jgi:hypothetical protein